MVMNKVKKAIITFLLPSLIMSGIFSVDSHAAKSEKVYASDSKKEGPESSPTVPESSSAVPENSPTAPESSPVVPESTPTASPESSPVAPESTPTPSAVPENPTKKNILAKAKILIDSLTKEDMLPEEKLQKVWKYLSDKKNVKYDKKKVKVSKANKAYEYANIVFDKNRGNEYALNSAFAVAATEIGYHAYLFTGKTWKKKNRGKGPKKPQAFVVISNMHYDVASANSGFCKGIYKKKSYNISFFPEFGYDLYDDKSERGVLRIAGHIYGFNAGGNVLHSKKGTKVVKAGNDKLLVNKYGRAQKGWKITKKNIFYFGGKSHKAVKNKTIKGIPFSSKGKAKKCLNTSLKIKTHRILKAITKSSDSKMTKLRKAFYYLASHRHFSYQIKYPNLASKSWAKEYANYMLTARRGNCFGFACTFAALASEIGYSPIVLRGRIHGSRDHARDGFTRHGVVMIGGRYYDPEGQWAGFLHGVFARSGYPMTIKDRHYHSFNKQPGTSGTGNSTKKTKNKVVKKSGKYYYYGTNGKLQKGTFYIKDKLYNFNSKHYMTNSLYKKYQKAIKEKTPFENLKKLIGKPSSTKDNGESCYGPDGHDMIYSYKHFKVYTYKTETSEIVVSLTGSSK